MKKKISLILAVIMSALMIFSFAAHADFNDYDYNDYSSFDFGSNDYDDDRDSSSGYSGYTNDGSGGGGGGPLGWVIPVVVIAIIIIAIISSKNKGGNGGNPQGGGVRSAVGGGQGRNVVVPDRTAQIESIIKQDDPNFTAGDINAFVKEVYMDYLNAWNKRDVTLIQPVLHSNLYNTTARQIQSKIDQHVTYHYESINVNTSYLTSYVRDNEYEYLTVYLNARCIDYQTDDNTGDIIRGDKNTRWDFRHLIKLMRSVGTKTVGAEDNNMNGHTCPNCGAPLEISSTGKCAYCGSTVTTGLYSWVMSEITVVRDDTKDEGIKVPNSGNTNNNSDNTGNNGGSAQQ